MRKPRPATYNPAQALHLIANDRTGSPLSCPSCSGNIERSPSLTPPAPYSHVTLRCTSCGRVAAISLARPETVQFPIVFVNGTHRSRVSFRERFVGRAGTPTSRNPGTEQPGLARQPSGRRVRVFHISPTGNGKE
jgi:hypothetical protein